MKKFILSAIIIAAMSLNFGATAYNNYNYNNNYNNSYNHYHQGYHQTSYYSHSAYARVCGFNGYKFQTYNSVSLLRQQRNYIFAYAGNCTSSGNTKYKRNIGYYSKFENYHWEQPQRFYTSRVNYSNVSQCSVYNMRTLVPQCQYKYSTDKYGCTRPIIHCDGHVKNKYVDNNTYRFQSTGIKSNTNSCPKFNLSAVVNGCEYKYVKNEDNCDIPKLVCGKDRVYKKTQTTPTGGNNQVTPIFDIIQ